MGSRLTKIRSILEDSKINGLLLTSASNRRYSTGFTGSSGYALITMQEALFITDFRYIDQAKEQAPDFKIVQHQGPIVDTVKELLDKYAINSLGFEEDFVTYALYQQFDKKFSGVDLVPLAQAVEKLRQIKDEAELALLRKAANIADQAFSYILTVIKPGMREVDVATQMENKMKELGAKGASFDIIIASGHRSALPHGIASDKIIEAGDFVTMDFGALYQGYVSDITRTIVMGQPSEKQREIYNLVLEAQLNGVNNLKAGMTGIEGDALTREIITNRGYGEQFGHGTGHGVGMDVHEEPRLSPKAEGVILKPGMVVTVEPGVYISGFGGVRIEDDVVITEDGVEILTKSTKDLVVIA